jgi:hypothetical protein
MRNSMEKFEKPCMEMVMFNDEDIIRTSGCPTVCEGKCHHICDYDTCESNL